MEKKQRILKSIKELTEDYLHGDTRAMKEMAYYVQALVDTDQFEEAAEVSGIIKHLMENERPEDMGLK